MIFKVSYVVVGGEFPGGIRNEPERPQVGDTVQIGRLKFQVVEIHEIIPPRDDFQFLHATIKPLEEAPNGEAAPDS
ncbi:MAG TPA: hypothetical protein VHO69_01315 [Phototrophicaceae bacterium]|nr:hypothetical protein [Phototrophicaceae bacterium]